MSLHESLYSAVDAMLKSKQLFTDFSRNEELLDDEVPMKEEIKILTTYDNNVPITGIEPVRGSTFAACKDLFSPVDCVIPSGGRILIKTNIAIAWNNPNYYIQILSRSGLAYRNKVDVCAGVIDFDYRQNIGVLLHNFSDNDVLIRTGDRIAQYTYIKIIKEKCNLVNDFSIPLQSNRTGGWGSTGR